TSTSILGRSWIGSIKCIEEVEQVHANHFQGSTYGWSRSRSRIGGIKVHISVQSVERTNTISVATGGIASPGIRHNTDNACGSIAAAQCVTGAEWKSTAAKHNRIGILSLR